MKRWPWLVWTVAGTLAAAGCGKHKPAAATGEPQALTHAPTIPAPQGPVVIADSGNSQATLNQLSLQLRRYVLRTRTAPKTFEEFVTKAQVQAPPPPAGKKYALQAGAVVLVNR